MDTRWAHRRDAPPRDTDEIVSTHFSAARRTRTRPAAFLAFRALERTRASDLAGFVRCSERKAGYRYEKQQDRGDRERPIHYSISNVIQRPPPPALEIRSRRDTGNEK